MKPTRKSTPGRAELIDFFDGCDAPVGKREIARAFGLRGKGKAILNDLLHGFTHPRLLDRGLPAARPAR